MANNRILADFTKKFVSPDGSVDWDAIVEFNSGSPSRKAAEEMLQLKERILRAIEENPDITLKPLNKAMGCGPTKLSIALESLIDEGKLVRGHKGKTYGWTRVSS